MKNDAKPYSWGTTLAVGLGTAVVFALLSFFFLYLQAHNTSHRLAGEVIAIGDDGLNIRNARGVITVMTLQPDARLRGVDDLAEINPGQHVMTRGDFADDGTFLVDGLRIIRGPDIP